MYKNFVGTYETVCMESYSTLYLGCWKILSLLNALLRIMFVLSCVIIVLLLTALFNNTWTLKLKAQLTNAFFAAINQVVGRSS